MEKINLEGSDERNKKIINIGKDLFVFNSVYFNFIQKMKKKPYKILYKGILPKIIRKKFERHADLYQQEYIGKCWDKVMEAYFRFMEQGGKSLSEGILLKNELKNRKIIWQYWGTGWNDDDLPDIVRLCRKSVEKYKGDYEVIRLSDENINEYIELPEFIQEKKKKGQIPFPFFADILRLALLYTYGGVWLDATILLTDFLPVEYSEMGYFVFQRDNSIENVKYWEKMNNDYFSWNKRHSVNMLNSIIFSQRGDRVIGSLLDLILVFWQERDEVPHYFFFQILYDRLMKKYMKEKRCKVVDDTLPHILFSFWNEKFDEKIYNEIRKKINMHKLTHKQVEKNHIRGSFYDYFIKNIQEQENEG